MRHSVLFTHGAERDLEELYDFIAASDSPAHADRVLQHIVSAARALSTHPERGAPPRELRELGIREYRQVLHKPYRIIYRVVDNRVIVYLIADGRRDMRSLLARRLLSA